MATRSLGNLTLDLVARIGGFTGPMDQAARHSEKRMKEIKRDAEKLGKAIGVGLTVAAGATVALVKSSIDAADKARKTAQAIGITTEAFTGLTFAAGLSGLSQEQFAGAMGRLNATIGDASSGLKSQSAYFKALGISVTDASGKVKAGDEVLKELADRFAEMPDGADKSAAAMKLFGKAGAAMIPLLNGGSKGIEDLTGKAEALGLVISDSTARQAEQFNDSLTVLNATMKGAANQVSASFLPLLNDLTSALMDMTADGTIAAVTTETIIPIFKGIAATAIGATAAVKLLGNSLAGISAMIAEADLKWYEVLSPESAFVRVMRNWKNIKDQGEIVGEDLEETISKYAKILNKLWDAGSGKDSGALAQIKEASVYLKTLRTELGNDDDSDGKNREKTINEINLQIEAIEKEAATFGMAADAIVLYSLAQKGATKEQISRARAALESVQAQKDLKEQEEKEAEAKKKIADDYKSLLSDLRTEEEALTDKMRERLAVLDKIGNISDKTRANVASGIVADAFTTAPKYEGLAPEVGGAAGEWTKTYEAESELEAWYQTQLEMLEKFRSERADLAAQWDEQERAIAEEHREKLAKIEQARAFAQMATAEEAFGTLTDLTRQFAGEQSDIYKAMFAVQKGIAIAESIVAIQAGIAKAANNPWPANLAAMVSVASATASILSTIMSVSIDGSAHAGIDSVPQDGTWLLKKGERVVTEKTSAKLDAALSRLQQGMVQKQETSSTPQNIRIVNAFDNSVVGDYLGSDAGERKIMNVVKRNPGLIRQLVGT